MQGEWLNRVTLQPRGMAVVYWFMAIDLTLRLFLYYRLSVKPNVKNPVEKQCRKEKVPDSLPIGRSIFQEEGYLPPHLLPATLNHPVFNQVWHISHKIGAAIPGVITSYSIHYTKLYDHSLLAVPRIARLWQRLLNIGPSCYRLLYNGFASYNFV